MMATRVIGGLDEKETWYRDENGQDEIVRHTSYMGSFGLGGPRLLTRNLLGLHCFIFAGRE